MVLLDRNPFDDISNTRDPAGVMIRGRWIGDVQLERIAGMLVRSYSNVARRIREASESRALSLQPDRTRRYRISSFDLLLGEELVSVDPPAGATQRIEARMVLDAAPGVAVVETRVSSDVDSGVRLVRCDIQYFEGRVGFRFRRMRDKVIVTTTARGGDSPVSTEFLVDGNSVAGPIEVATFQPIMHSILPLDPGESREWPVIRLEHELAQLSSGTLKISRIPESHPWNGPSLDRRFTLEEKLKNGTFSGELGLTPEGIVQHLSWSGSIGEMVWSLF